MKCCSKFGTPQYYHGEEGAPCGQWELHCCHIGTYLRKWYVKRTILPKTLFYGTFFAHKVGIFLMRLLICSLSSLTLSVTASCSTALLLE